MRMSINMQQLLSKISIQEYYEKYAEGERLFVGLGPLEFERSKILINKHVPPSPATVIDVGGGTGPYSFWLAKQGYKVHLIEPSPTLIQQAQQAAQIQSDAPIDSIRIGDARSLDFPDESADIILLFGPLYHLTAEDERHQALQEAYRVLKKGGVLFAAAISRFASAIDGFLSGFTNDPLFADMVKQDLITGRHHNPTDNIMYFTDAYFHLPSEFKMEIEQAGFKCERVYPVEGIGALVKNFEAIWSDAGKQNYLLQIIELTEKEQEILGISPHLLGVAYKALF